jgi:hypothetical protein
MSTPGSGPDYPPQFGQPQYGPPQDQPPYGQPPQPPYGQPPQYGPPPQGPPPYQQQPYADGSAPGRNRTPLVVGILTAAAVIIALVLFFTLHGGSTSYGSPQDAVKAYFNALKARDLSKVKAAVCTERRGEITSSDLPDQDADVSKATLKVGDTTRQDSTHATVHVTVNTPKEGSTSSDLKTVKENGKWLVCGVSGTSGTGVGS